MVESSDDDEELVFGELDSQPDVATEMKVRKELAVSYDNIWDHRTFD